MIKNSELMEKKLNDKGLKEKYLHKFGLLKFDYNNMIRDLTDSP
jgi:hypothetical protein